MATSHPTASSQKLAGRGTATSLVAPTLWMPFIEFQRLQWQSFLAWQQTLFVFSRDLWEQWACRYAGGVPIDG